MEAKYPTVTVIINTFERPKMLDRAMRSVLQQSFQDYEVIVIHDGPACDETQQVLEKYSTLFPDDIAYTALATDQCSGYQCQPKNIATYMAKGDYIAYLDDDNEWMDDHLEVLVAAIEGGTPGAWPDFVYGKREYIVEESYPGDKKVREGISPFVPWDEEAKKLIAVAVTNFIDTGDFLITRGAMWRVQATTGCMWNEGLRRMGDWELLCRAVHFTGLRARAIDHVVQKYYWHATNLQTTRS
jgi:glycosyltransferase involved in cell wall biosynthesis